MYLRFKLLFKYYAAYRSFNLLRFDQNGGSTIYMVSLQMRVATPDRKGHFLEKRTSINETKYLKAKGKQEI